MAALRDLFCFAANNKHPALVIVSYPGTFNLALLRWHAMHLGTRMCLLSPTNWELCDRHKKWHLQGRAPNVTTLWQSQWWIDSQVCFKWGGKGFCFSRHPRRDEEGISLNGMLLELFGINVNDCHMHKQASFKSVHSNSGVILALALFFTQIRMHFVDGCTSWTACGYLWVSYSAAYYLHRCCWNIRSLEVFLSVKCIALITTLWMCFARCVLPRVVFFHLRSISMSVAARSASFLSS